MEENSSTTGNVAETDVFSEGESFDETRDIDGELAELDEEIAAAPDEATRKDLNALKIELLALKAELSGDKEEAERLYRKAEAYYKGEIDPEAARIIENGPTSAKEVVQLVEALSFEEVRQRDLTEKYGKGFVGRFRAFIAGELDSELVGGKDAQKAWWEKEAIRKTLISIFNKQNLYAAGAAIAVGVLTGGVGAAAAGVVVGGILGRGAAEAWESTRGEEKSARGTMLEAERAHWIRLQDLAAEYKNAPAEEKAAKLQILIDEFYRNSQSASVLAMTKAQEDLAITIAKWNNRRVLCQTAGGLAGGVLGFGINAFGTHSFSGIDMDGLRHIPKETFHNVQRINGIWYFAYKTGETATHAAINHGGALWHITGETTAKVYAAAAAKAAPTIAAFLLANLGRKKLDGKKMGTFYEGSPLEKNKAAVLGSLGQPAPVDSTRQTSSTVAAPQRAGEERAMTREEILDDSNDNDWRFSRRTAMIILGRVKKYAELNAKTKEEREKLFIAKAKEVLREAIVVHWRNSDSEKNKRRSDLDGEIALYLLALAVGDGFEFSFVPPGDYKKDHINIDTGNKDGIAFEPKEIKNGEIPATVFVDHHGSHSKDDSSAADYWYETLINLGVLERSQRLDKLVNFVTQADNQNGVYLDSAHYKKSHRTIAGLYRLMGRKGIIDFFTNDPNPDPARELNDEEFRKYGVVFEAKDKQEDGTMVEKTVNLSEIQRENNEEAEKIITELIANGKLINTPFGKLLIDEGGRIKVPSAVLSKGYIHLRYDKNGFVISVMPQGLNLPEGSRLRNMWTHRSKPTLKIEDIISAFMASKAQMAQAA